MVNAGGRSRPHKTTRLLRTAVGALAAVLIGLAGLAPTALQATAALPGQGSAAALIASGRVTGASEPMAQLQAWASGSPRVVNGRTCNVDGVLLDALANVVVTKGYSIHVTSLNRYCISALTDSGTSSFHWRDGGGHAIDISRVNGVTSTGGTAQDIALIREFAGVVPTPAGVGQSNCRSSISLPVGVLQFSDTCNHVHLEYRGAATANPGISGSVYEAASDNGWANLPAGMQGTDVAATTVGGVKYLYTLRDGVVYEAASNNGWLNQSTQISRASDLAAVSVNGVKYVYTLVGDQVYEAASNNGWRNLPTGVTQASRMTAMSVGGVTYIYTLVGGQVYEAASNNGWRNLPTGITGASEIAATSVGGTKRVYTLVGGQVYEAASDNAWRNLPLGIGGATDVAATSIGGVKYVYTVIGGRVYEAASDNGWRNLPPGVPASKVAATVVGDVKFLYSIS